MRADRPHRVVQMHHPKVPVAADRVEAGENLSGAARRGHVVAGSGHVAGVETPRDALRLGEMAADVRQVLEGAAQHRAGAGRRLQARRHAVARQLTVDSIEGLDDAAKARQLICGHSPGRPNAPGVRAGSGFALVRAGMKHAQRYPQRLAAVELLPVQGD